MKKLLLTVITFALIGIACTGQMKYHIDKITSDTIWITNSEKLYSKVSFSGTAGELLEVSLQKSKLGKTLSFYIRTGKTSIFYISKNHQAFIKLKNDSVITLSPVTVKVSDYTGSSYGSGNTGIYYLSEKDVQLLKDNPVKFIRVQSSEGNMEYDIKEKLSSVIQKSAASIF